MKIWTQDEFERACILTGEIVLGTGDFRRVDFGGKSGLTIGPQSIIGKNAHLGMACEIGHHSEIGEGFCADGNLTIGPHCHFGAGARVGEITKVGRGTCFADGAEIGNGSEIADGVGLPPRCELFGVRGADGRTLMRITPVAGRMLYAFAAWRPNRRTWQVMVCMPQMWRTLAEFEDFAADQATMQGMSATREHIAEGQQLLAAAKYIRARFALMGYCDPYRQK